MEPKTIDTSIESCSNHLNSDSPTQPPSLTSSNSDSNSHSNSHSNPNSDSNSNNNSHSNSNSNSNHDSASKKRTFESSDSEPHSPEQSSKHQKTETPPEGQNEPVQERSQEQEVGQKSSTDCSSPISIPQKKVDLSSTERFNLEQLKNLTEGDPEFETELLTLYKQDLQPSLDKLISAFNTKSHKQCILFSHDLKGASANIGADAIREIGRVMEELCKDGFLEEAQSYLEQLKEEIRRIHPILDQHLASLSSSS